jgi:hypothetical protein
MGATKAHGGARKGAGRPKATDPRDQLIKVYVTASELEQIASLAAAEDRTVSDVTREAVLVRVERRKLEG